MIIFTHADGSRIGRGFTGVYYPHMPIGKAGDHYDGLWGARCLQYLATGSTLTAVGPFQLPAPQSGTLSLISSETLPSVQTLSDICLKRICLLDASAFSALEVLDDNRAV